MVLAAGSRQGGPCEEKTDAAPIAAQLLQLQDCPKLSPPAVLAGAQCLKRLRTSMQQLWQRGVRKMQEKTLQTPRSAKREGGICSHGEAHGEDSGKEGCPTAAHEGPWWNTFTLQPVKEPCWSR